MVNKTLIAVLTATAFSLGPVMALADDTVVKKGSVEATGSGSAATVQQAQDDSDGDFEGALYALPFVAGGGVAAGVLLGGGDDGNDSTSTSTATATSPAD